MFQYWDSKQRGYVDFDPDTNELLTNSVKVLVYNRKGDRHLVYDLAEMTETDLIHQVKRKIRKV